MDVLLTGKDVNDIDVAAVLNANPQFLDAVDTVWQELILLAVDNIPDEAQNWILDQAVVILADQAARIFQNMLTNDRGAIAKLMGRFVAPILIGAYDIATQENELGATLIRLSRVNGMWTATNASVPGKVALQVRYTIGQVVAAGAPVLVPLLPEDDECNASVNTARLNLRAGPSPDFAILGTYSQGTRVRILAPAAQGNWVQVKICGSIVSGWMNAAYLRLDG
jgi:hypothetical protein